MGRALRGNKPLRKKGSGSRPQASGKIRIKFYNPRDFTKDKNKRVDKKPYGGGPGMVLEPKSVLKSFEKALSNSKSSKILCIWLSPRDKIFDNKEAEKISKKYKDIIIICGRYEGIDERVFKAIKNIKKVKIEKISIGPFILTGGELPAMIIMDSVSRRIPGILGKIESLEENRISSSEVYTRPESFLYKGKNYKVPKVLLSGHHKMIENWRKNIK